MPTSATSFADALASATATSLASSTTGARINSYALPSLASNPMAVGAAWMISSALFTTYSTTKFIRMSNQQTENISSMTAKGTGLLRPRPSPLASERERLPNRLRRTLLSMSQTLPPASLLTMYRFTGSLLFGLVLHTDVWAIGDRLRATLAAVPALALPAVFLFIANFSNS